MPRAPYQVLAYPWTRLSDGSLRYALLRRSDLGWWQGIAGGGEDFESPVEAARREAQEEAGIPQNADFMQLTTVAPIPVGMFKDAHLFSQLWGADVYVIPQYCFGVSVASSELALSPEHTEYRWLSYETAQTMLEHDGNRTALWELHARLSGLEPATLGTRGLIELKQTGD